MPDDLLVPAPLDIHVRASARFPVRRRPVRGRVRAAIVAPVNPDVAVAIPTVIAVDPHPTFMRWMVVDLDDGRGRPHTHNDLRHNGGRNETDSKQQ